ncbi:MAG: RHS repeat-associated core domain-containing protein [Deltaproteobacteria bacterium]|nr:RHS repeat-associated core domain-containing protein [Deltaproteobacteria bacterium]
MKKIALGLIGFLLWSSVATAHVYYSHTDHLNSAQLITNEVGEVSQLESYTPFGEILQEKGWGDGPTTYLYTHQELDRSSELYYYGARYYDPVTARFASADPVLMNLPYSYVLNNPIKYTDPNGLEEEEKTQPPPPSWRESLRNRLGATFPPFGPPGELPAVPNSWGGAYNTSLPGPVVSPPNGRPGVKTVRSAVDRILPIYYGTEPVTKEAIDQALGELMRMSFQIVPYPLGSPEGEGSEKDTDVTWIRKRFYHPINPEARQLRTDIYNYLVQESRDAGTDLDPLSTVHDPLGVNNPKEFQKKFLHFVMSLHKDIGRYRDNPAGLQGDLQARSALDIANRLQELTESSEGG